MSLLAETCKDGMEAAYIGKVHPDLILMDMKMPNLDGNRRHTHHP